MPDPTPEQRAAAAEWIHRWRLDASHGYVEALAELLAQCEQWQESRVVELERRARLAVGTLPCGGCGGPHQFDTAVPSVVWNAVIRGRGLSEYLCTSCIVREFVKAGQSFTATLWGDFDGADFRGQPIEVRVGGVPAEDAKRINEENNALRAALSFVPDTLQEPLAHLVRRCAKDEPHDHALLRALRAVTERAEAALAACTAPGRTGDRP